MAERTAPTKHREAALRLGPADGPLVLVSPALFAEANRTRAFTVAIMRHLAAQGLASLLPDLPGTGDSLVPSEDARFDHWRSAFGDHVGDRPTVSFAVRGGALIDTSSTLAGRYHLSPIAGAAVVRDLVRIRNAGTAPDSPRMSEADVHARVSEA